jgi:hypothetical protein
MTPERIAELRTRYPSLKFVAELADEIDRLREERDRRVRQRDNAHKARIGAERERDDARTVATRLLTDIELSVGFDAVKSLNLATLPTWATPGLAAERARAASEREPLTEAEAEDLKRRFLEAQQTHPIRRIVYPEIDYPHGLRDDQQPWPLPVINSIIDQEEAEHGLARSKWAPENCTCPWPWPLNGRHIRTNCPAGTNQD